MVYNCLKMKSNWQIFKYVLLLFLGWRLALLFIAFFGLSTLPSRNGITDELFLPSPEISYWFRWSNWDGGHFRGIVENGYLPQQTVFFPLYPLLMKILNIVGLDITFAGLLISHLSLIASLFFLYKLTILDFPEKVAKRAIFALLIFPTSFYLGTVYSESLFLAVTLACFYFARTQKTVLSSFFAAASVATRLAGLATFAAILGDHLLKELKNFKIPLLWQTKLRRLLIYFITCSIVIKIILELILPLKLFLLLGSLDSILQIIFFAIIFTFTLVFAEFLFKNINFRKILTLKTFLPCLSLLPVPLYMLFQQALFQNPLGFLINETNWNRHFSLPWEPILGYLNHLKSVGIFQIGNPARVFTELAFFIGGVFGFIFSLYKLKPAYSIFYGLSLILPTFSNTLIAMPRYMLTIFPIFILLGLIENEFLQKIGIIFSVLLLSAYTMLFMGWYWVT